MESKWATAWLAVAAALLTGAADAKLISLDEGNWTMVLEKEWMMEFMAPWCPACVALRHTWLSLAFKSEELGINVAEVDVTEAPGLSGRFLVTALPTIYHVINGEFRQYKGPRDPDSLYAFVEAKKWKMIDPVPWWKDPGSMQMAYVSYFFKMSQVLRVVHTTLLETYGLPTWGSYLVFAIGTILLGSLIGLLMVACIDFLYPQKGPGRRPPAPLPVATVEAEVMNDDLVDEDAENSGEESQETDRDEEKNSASDSEDSGSDEETKSGEDDARSSPGVRRRKPTPKAE